MYRITYYRTTLVVVQYQTTVPTVGTGPHVVAMYFSRDLRYFSDLRVKR
jgi:hypothetical protein